MDFSSLQGWSGTWFTFASVQTTMWIGLARGRAGIGKYLISPLVAAPLTAAAAGGYSSIGDASCLCFIFRHAKVRYKLRLMTQAEVDRVWAEQGQLNLGAGI